jgi:isopentenyldiphosphate isomerase
MTEIWDIYDETGNRTGKTMERGKPAKGDYMLCVHMYIYNSDDKFLIQLRSMEKELYPGIWDITGGAVLHGEDSIDGAKREVMEEIGLDINNAEINKVARLKRERSFVDIYFIKMEYNLKDCVLQQEEVSDVKMVDSHEIIRMVKKFEVRDEEYLQVITDAIQVIENNRPRT